MSTKNNKSLIINKIISFYNFKSDKEFADFLEIKPQTLSSWRTRNTIDYDLIFAKCVEINMNWVFTGEGSMLKQIPLDRKEQPLDNFLQEPEPDKIYKRNYSKQEQETIEDANGTQLLKLKLEHAESTIQALQQTIELQKKMIEFLTK